MVFFVHRDFDRAHGPGTGWFGFFDCEDDAGVCWALLAAGLTWLRSRGCTRVVGPVAFTPEAGAGLPTARHGERDVVGAPSCVAHLPGLLVECGPEPCHELHRWRWSIPVGAEGASLGAARAIAARLGRNGRVSAHPVHIERIEDELGWWQRLHEAAGTDGWGSAPSDATVFEGLARELTRRTEPGLFSRVDVDGEAVATGLMVPDHNQVLAGCGLLGTSLPLRGITHRSLIDHARHPYLAVHPRWRDRGLECLLRVHLAEAARDRGIRSADLGPAFDDDPVFHQVARQVGARRERSYRLYGRILS